MTTAAIALVGTTLERRRAGAVTFRVSRNVLSRAAYPSEQCERFNCSIGDHGESIGWPRRTTVRLVQGNVGFWNGANDKERLPAATLTRDGDGTLCLLIVLGFGVAFSVPVTLLQRPGASRAGETQRNAPLQDHSGGRDLRS